MRNWRRPGPERVSALPTSLVETCELVGGELDVRGGDVLLEVLDRASAGDGKHHGAAGEQPGDRHLPRRRVVRGRDLGDRPARLSETAGGQREPRDEADAVGLAVVEHFFGLPVGEVVEVLHRGDLEDSLRRLDLLDGDLRQPEMADLALVLELLHEPELLLARHLGIDPVQLPQVDGLNAKPTHAHQAALAQVLRPAHRRPDAGAMPRKTTLRRDVDAVERMQSLLDEVLGGLGSVDVGGLDESDTMLGQPLENVYTG